MKISQGGIGSSLFSVLGGVLRELSKAGPIEVTYRELIERVRQTDRYTSLVHYSDHVRHHKPVGPQEYSIRRALKRASDAGLIAVSREKERSPTMCVFRRT
jgi:hypothetical protein